MTEKRLSSMYQRVTSTKKVARVPGRMLLDVEELILYSGAKFGYTTFDAVDVTKPIHLGEGNVVFPVGWSSPQCEQWRISNNVSVKDTLH